MSESIKPEPSCLVRSREEAREWFKATGTSVTDWARSQGFQRAHVYAVLAGRTSGDRGNAHVVAMALGLKPPPPADFKPVARSASDKKEAIALTT